MGLKVVTAIAEVEALVTNGEIGDAIAPHGHGETHPVVDGGVYHFVCLDLPVGRGLSNVAQDATPSLDERYHSLARTERQVIALGRLGEGGLIGNEGADCLLYTSPSPRDS